jgi:hypothetical protein
MVRLTTKLKQLTAEKEETMTTLDDIDKSLLQGIIHEPTYNELKRKYESRLIQIEQEIFETEKKVEKRKKKKAKASRKKKKEAQEAKEEPVTLDRLHLQRNFLQKTMDVLEENHTNDLDDAIVTLLTETSQMGKKLSAQEITHQLRINTLETISKTDVIDSLIKLVKEGIVHRDEDTNKNLSYFMDVSWKVDSLVTMRH